MKTSIELLIAGKVIYTARLDETSVQKALRASNAGAEAVVFRFSQGKGGLLKEVCSKLSKSLIIGACEITGSDAAFEAVEAGAKFICAPLPDPAIYKTCANLSVPILGEAATANELRVAVSCGADMVTLFPAAPLGAEMMKALSRRFAIPIAAAGGITASNAAVLKKAGACCFFTDEGIAEGALKELIAIARG